MHADPINESNTIDENPNVKELKIYGCSDDLIELEGCISEEFGAYGLDEDDAKYLAFSDGTCISVFYDHDGIWRFNLKYRGTAEYHKQECVSGDDGDEYSDVITLRGDNLKYAIFGSIAT